MNVTPLFVLLIAGGLAVSPCSVPAAFAGDDSTTTTSKTIESGDMDGDTTITKKKTVTSDGLDEKRITKKKTIETDGDDTTITKEKKITEE